MSGRPEAINSWELEALARKLLPEMAFDYYASGANDEITLRENRAAYERITLLPHMLVDVSVRDMGTTVLGEPVSMPILIAPMALPGLAHPEGASGATRAAGAARTIITLATLSTSSIEEDMAVATGPVWFQLYVFKDREVTASLVQRAETAGCKAIVLTVDVPLSGRRERDVRNRLTLPEHLSIKNLLPAGCQKVPENDAGSGMSAYVNSLFDATLTWKDLGWLVQMTRLPVIVKGVLRVDDALRAIDHGASAIVVSNHGGRQLDTTPATISVLPGIVDSVAAAAEVYVDGGIRRGTDILKAMAYGARAVLVGRPILWGLAVGGEAGVKSVLEMLRQEFDLAMALWAARISLLSPEILSVLCRMTLIFWLNLRLLAQLTLERKACFWLRC